MSDHADREDTTPRRSMHYRDPFAERLRRMEVRVHDLELIVLVLGTVEVAGLLALGLVRWW